MDECLLGIADLIIENNESTYDRHSLAQLVKDCIDEELLFIGFFL